MPMASCSDLCIVSLICSSQTDYLVHVCCILATMHVCNFASRLSVEGRGHCCFARAGVESSESSTNVQQLFGVASRCFQPFTESQPEVQR